MKLLFANGILLSEINHEYKYTDPQDYKTCRRVTILVPLEKGTVLTLIDSDFIPESKRELILGEAAFKGGYIEADFGSPHILRC